MALPPAPTDADLRSNPSIAADKLSAMRDDAETRIAAVEGGTTAELSDDAPAALASTATAGVGTTASRGDHAHAAPAKFRRHSAAWTRPADSAAGDASAEFVIYVAEDAETVTGAKVDAVAAVTGDDTDNATITLRRRDNAGGAAAVISSITTDVASGGLAAWVSKAFGSLANTTLAAQSKVTAQVTKGGSGVQLPVLTVSLATTKD